MITSLMMGMLGGAGILGSGYGLARKKLQREPFTAITELKSEKEQNDVRDIKNPTVNYPKAVFGGALVTVLIFVLGTYALGVIIPAKDINLVQSLLVGFDNYFSAFHMNWFTPVIAIALAFGVLAGVLTWVAGPSKGVFAVGQAGYLPPFFQKTNKAGVQKNILLIQGGAVTLLSLLFVVMPSVESFYQIL